MKVLLVHPKFELYGGAELVVVKLANYLSRRGIGNALLTTNITPQIEKDLAGTRVIKYPLRRFTGASRPLNLLRTIARLHYGLRKYGRAFNVVNVHNYPAEIAAFALSRPVVWMCNEPPEVEVQFQREAEGSLRQRAIGALLAFERRMVRRYIQSVVVADAFNAERFTRMYGLRPQIIRYGVDYDFFSALPPMSKTTHDRFTILQVGTLNPMKNQMQSLRVLQALKPGIPGIRLILAGFGRGAYQASLEAYVLTYQLRDQVLFTGHIDRRQLRRLYREAHVLIHPIKPQGGWLSPFEALCARLPVVVSPEMAAADLIASENLGTVTHAYTDAVFDIYRHPAKYATLAPKRARWVGKNLTWNIYCKRMYDLFVRITRNRSQNQIK